MSFYGDGRGEKLGVIRLAESIKNGGGKSCGQVRRNSGMGVFKIAEEHKEHVMS